MTASVQSPLKDGEGITTRRSMCAVSTSRQAGEGLRGFDRCIQAVCPVAGGRRMWEATTRTESNWSRVKGSYLSWQLHPHDESVAGNKHCRWSGGGGVAEKQEASTGVITICFLSSLSQEAGIVYYKNNNSEKKKKCSLLPCKMLL